MNKANYQALSSCGSYAGQMYCPCAAKYQFSNLRAVELRDDGFRKALVTVFQQVRVLVSGLLFFEPAKANSMCKYYGHVIDGPWMGNFPRCADCCVTIQSSDQLRKSTSPKVYRVC